MPERPKPEGKKARSGKFPFEFVHNIETDNNFPEQHIFSQKLQVKNNLTARSYNFSPNRGQALRNEEKVAFFLNNVASNDYGMRPPPLADEIIITHNEERR